MGVMDKRSKKRLLESSSLGAGALLALAMVLIVNYFGWKYHARFDWTSNNLYSLSEKSLNVVGGLETDIEAIVLMGPGEPLYDAVRELLERYDAASQRLTVSYVDPHKSPLVAQPLVDQYNLTQLDVVIFDSGEDRRIVESLDLADYDYSGAQFGQGPVMEGFKGEQAFTGALLELSENRKPKILFTSGHGERGIDDPSAGGFSQAQDLLGRDNFELESWPTLGQISVPADTDLIVIAGPTARFAESEVATLSAFLASGGRLLAFFDPTVAPSGELAATGLEELLSGYGIQVGRDIVVDPASPLPFYGPETIYANAYGGHSITRSLQQTQVPVILSLARSVGSIDEVEGWESTDLVLTSSEGWGETNLSDLTRVALEDDDLAGPVSLGIAVAAASESDDPAVPEVAELEPLESLPEEGEVESGEEMSEDSADGAATRIVVFGDSDFASNAQLANVGNAELLANSMNWLVEREALVGIAPKRPEQVRLSLSSSQLMRVLWLVLAVLPGLAILSGVWVHFRRRR